MTRDQRRLTGYLAHILEAIERIDRYTGDMDELAFMNNPLVQDAVIRNFEIIGEASNNIEKHYPEFAANKPRIVPWHSRTRCATLWRMATSKWILKSSGRRFTAIFPACTHRFRTRGPPCKATLAMKGIEP